MLVDALGVDERELGQCLFPVGDDLALDESSGCFAFVGWESFLFGAVAGSFVLDVTCFSSNVAFSVFDQSTPCGFGRWL